jgi:hypothetical protein
MTLLEKFLAADKKVTELENNGGLYLEGYGGVDSTKEYDKALETAQKLYQELEKKGINPFS